MKLTIEYTRVLVLIRHYHQDSVTIVTTMPSPHVAAYSEDPLTLTFNCTKGCGIRYAQDVLGIDESAIEVINDSGGFGKFSKKGS